MSQNASLGRFDRTSAAITGRRPFAKDNNQLDYEYDSEEEWEEEEDGEDLRSEEDEDDSSSRAAESDDEDDGWLVADDDRLGDDSIGTPKLSLSTGKRTKVFKILEPTVYEPLFDDLTLCELAPNARFAEYACEILVEGGREDNYVLRAGFDFSPNKPGGTSIPSTSAFPNHPPKIWLQPQRSRWAQNLGHQRALGDGSPRYSRKRRLPNWRAWVPCLSPAAEHIDTQHLISMCKDLRSHCRICLRSSNKGLARTRFPSSSAQFCRPERIRFPDVPKNQIGIKLREIAESRKGNVSRGRIGGAMTPEFTIAG